MHTPQTATFRQPGAVEMGEYDYSRSGNPTRTALERQVAALEASGRGEGDVLLNGVRVRVGGIEGRMDGRVKSSRPAPPPAPPRIALTLSLPHPCLGSPAPPPPHPTPHPTTTTTQGGERAFAFASGMAALAAVTRLLAAGDHVVAGDDLYGGTSRLLSRVVPAAGVEVTNVDTTDLG